MELIFEQLPQAVGQILESLARTQDLLSQKVDCTKSCDNTNSILTVHEASKILITTNSKNYKHTFRRELCLCTGFKCII